MTTTECKAVYHICKELGQPCEYATDFGYCSKTGCHKIRGTYFAADTVQVTDQMTLIAQLMRRVEELEKKANKTAEILEVSTDERF